MLQLVIGLVLFLAIHSIRIVAEDARTGLVARLGPGAYKGLYAVISVIGFVLIVQGYAASRIQPVELWPAWSAGRHIAALLSLSSFVLVVAAYVPRNAIKARLRHPMVLGIKLWAFGHLLANNSLADLLLFGSMLVWAVLSFRAARRRDALAASALGSAGLSKGADQTAGDARSSSRLADLAVLAIGLAAYWAFAFHLHASLIGVRPFG